jgi:hypothetical protein
MEYLLDSIKEKLGDDLYPSFIELIGFISANYNASELYDGKNEIKFRQGGKTLVTILIGENEFTTLVIFGKQERAKFEPDMEVFSSFVKDYYDNSKTYHDGKWMFIKVSNSEHIKEIIELIKIKRKPNKKAITMCGYRCDLCKAYSKNIKKQDQREELLRIWKKYYAIDTSSDKIYCDGCRAKSKTAVRIDNGCPVCKCVLEKKLNSCADCDAYPCDVFVERRGLCYCDAKERAKSEFHDIEYEEYLLAYDNKTRIDRLKS